MSPKVNWRRLSGATEQAGTQTTPPISERSRSEGDLNRNSYRDSEHPRLSQRAVCNDDGTPIAEGTNEVLGAILEELRAIRAALERE